MVALVRVELLSDSKSRVTVEGLEGERSITLPIQKDVFEKKWKAYVQGGLMQDVFPELNEDEREFLITGLTKEEWDDIMSGGNLHNESEDDFDL